MRINPQKIQPKEIEQTQKILCDISIPPRKDFEHELEQKLFLALQKNSFNKTFFMRHHFTSKKLFLIAIPLILFIIIVTQPNFVSAQLNQIIKAGEKFLFGESHISFEEKNNIQGTYFTFDPLLEGKNVDAEAKRIFNENKDAIKKFIALTPEEVTNIIVRDEKVTGNMIGNDHGKEMYFVLLGKNQTPLRGGIISKKVTDQDNNTNENPDVALATLCTNLEENAAHVTTTPEFYEYDNPNWGLHYIVPNIKKLEASHTCGGSSGFSGTSLEINTQFTQTWDDTPTDNEESISSFLSVGIVFPDTKNIIEFNDTKKQFLVGNDVGYISESNNGLTGQHVGKIFTLRKNGLIYKVSFEAAPHLKDSYEKLFFLTLQSLKISDPLVIANPKENEAFIKVFEKGEVYTLENNTWIKNSDPNRTPDKDQYVPQKETSTETSEPTPKKARLPITFTLPTSKLIINQYFGERHTGIDIYGKTGDQVFAVADGKVTTSQCGWNGGYGCYIIIDHGHGVKTLYAQNANLLANVDETVKKGQTIAEVGTTGHSTGPHLHFEIQIDDIKVDPLLYLPQ